ncbi:MAG: type IV secretion system DNA-binding domain-containing protein [Alphaproteobacteria bacterium]|nr:type IV secretion system DNA-binding domain-containing protein [Alphaproteobacteria bacterium]
MEPQENISYGANSTRDGVSLSRHTRQKPLIIATELSQLENLECYVKFPRDYLCTKLQMIYQTPSDSSIPAFLLKPDKKRDYGEVQVPVSVPTDEKKPMVQEVTATPETSDEEQEEDLVGFM